ncbi:MAG: polysaccharide pyruvyl transferase family protein [Lachnospiraceae bacterium]|nr:polysaccharide pyruvyl transferase family protein [Lachnospiraceae bacterium]
MKIGILTWYYAMNHGARAHTYALVHTLRSMGYNAEIIAYQSWHSYWDVEPYWVVSKNIPFMVKRIHYRMSFKKTERDYEFLSKKVHTAKEIDGLGYDLIILGSDEIFNINHLITSKDYTYFGVGIEKTPMITYAVSCGQSDSDIKWPDEVVESVDRIKALSVRDSNSQRIVRSNTGREAELVLDPTLLYDFKNLSDKNWLYRDYILIYTFGFIEANKDQIVSYAKEQGKKIVCIGNAFAWADVNIQYPSQYQWYAAFEHADIVITNSFHGTIFAIKNQKPFINILMDDKVTKISNLLEQFGIEYKDRLLVNGKNDLSLVLQKRLSYEYITHTIQTQRAQSIKLLKEELSHAIKD